MSTTSGAALVDAGAEEWSIDLMTVSGTLVAVWFWVSGAVGSVVLVMANDSGKLSEYDDQAIAHLDLFSRLSETFGDLAMAMVGLFVASVSYAAVRTRFMPRWIGHVGLVVAVGCAVSLLGAAWMNPVFTTGFFVGLFGFFLWTLMTAVALCVRAVRSRSRLSRPRTRRAGPSGRPPSRRCGCGASPGRTAGGRPGPS